MAARKKVTRCPVEETMSTDWTKFDSQLRQYSSFFRDEFNITPPQSNSQPRSPGRGRCPFPVFAPSGIMQALIYEAVNVEVLSRIGGK